MRFALRITLGLISSASGQTAPFAHPYIEVFNEKNVKSAENDNLFLCPMNITDNINLTSWPSSEGVEIIINGTSCMDYDELMMVKKRGNFLKCLTEVVNTTTHVLDILGIDGSIIDGTLLGWMRHNKGQIPWDVDADLTIMQSHCQNVFNKYNNISTTTKHNNIASIIASHLPNDSYRVAAVKYNVGSELKPDEWEGCETEEFRVVHEYEQTRCHVDIFQMLQSSDPGSPCELCPGYESDQIVTCRSKNSDYCGYYDYYLPTTWDKLNNFTDVKIPNNPTAILSSIYNAWDLLNFQLIPGNYEFGDVVLVVGRRRFPLLVSDGPWNNALRGAAADMVGSFASFFSLTVICSSIIVVCFISIVKHRFRLSPAPNAHTSGMIPPSE